MRLRDVFTWRTARRVVGWGVRSFALLIGVAFVGFLLVVLMVTFEGRNAYPAPMADSAAIARHLPDARYRQAYEVGVDRAPEQVFAIARNVDLRDVPALKVLLNVQAVPAVASSLFGSGARPRRLPVTIDTLGAMRGYQVLEEVPGRTLVLGTIHRPWDGDAARPPFNPETFQTFRAPGWVKTAVSFEVVPRAAGGTRLVVEWRSDPTDAEAAQKYGWYWTVAKPVAQTIAKTGLPRLGDAAASAPAPPLPADTTAR